MKREFTCRECGAIFPAGTANCPKCGRELGLELQKKSPEGKQSATGFLAAILIGLLIGGLLYLAITAESEQRIKYEKHLLQNSQEMDQNVKEWTRMAEQAGH